ncbi:Ethanolamine utilization protein EutG [Thalassovita autumnalis]|uniref:Ethanolamine utilization protein EutG n=1 Tax=Thalassovita autumnalis TaxID=2072972 RepID=A0A0P1FLX9_9RHOB|nr:iron-containing alcohol dehydrogenase [Thalassovita autumnalis]CUH69148.1 Ethanolamine utilization protein EutG [Thalassovita autumnalis]CUH73649.1 Ethanolamine utilization protein EutG [Thalassovita autumnalis]
MSPFDFASAGRIRFGRGVIAEAPEAIAALGRRVFLVQGASARHGGALIPALSALGVQVVPFTCAKEPDLPLLNAAISEAQAAGVDCVVALGGGAAIDLGKAVAALIPAPGGAMDHLEVVGKGQPLTADPLPFVAIPTTAGTGAEVTKNAVITVPEHARKVSLRDARMLADLALVDPGLTDNTPKAVTLASGLDAVTQVIEPYLSARANPLTDALCRAAIPRGLSALRQLMQDEDPAARDDLAFTSLCGGLALANAGLGAVHGLAGVIGGVAPTAPHGAICGALLSHVLTANREACADQPDLLGRFDEVQDWIDGSLTERRSTLEQWSAQHGLPGLAAMGVSPETFAAIADAAAASSSMKANPVALPSDVLEQVLHAAA